MKINLWSGSYFNSSGFSSHTKQLFSALIAEGCDVRLQVPLPENWIRMVNDDELKSIQKEMSRDRTTIFIGHPQYLPLAWNDSDNCIPFVVWEGNKIPVYHLKYLLDERIKLIFVPSQHVKDAILRTVPLDNQEGETLEFYKLLEKIKIIPHGVDITKFIPKQKENKVFTFLCNKGYNPINGANDRGGVQFVIKAFYEEFTNKEPVQLLVKLNPAYLQAPFNVKEVLRITETKEKEDSPLIKVGADNVDYNYMPSIYHDADVFVCASMAEGFGLTMLESMACGIPVITTLFGGQADFVNTINGYFISGTYIENKWEPMYEGVLWLKPNIDELRKTMRYCYENKEEVKLKGLEARKTAENFTWQSTAKKVIEEIKKLK